MNRIGPVHKAPTAVTVYLSPMRSSTSPISAMSLAGGCGDEIAHLIHASVSAQQPS
ncbi:hypothetical protein [Massilia sp. CCM 8734]|uniref:hypothetical protein n=1 Tax=Massilia sp. CCM 8734 TaxID=2609283 RepID=UPI0014218165|nr:hypothetical protein [Massilia sp. CCM 8734]